MVKLFTDIDLDGLGCGLIAKIAFGDKADIAYCSYRNLNQRVENFIENPSHHDEEVYITDLAVNELVEKKLAKRFLEGKHVRMIDHHVTALHFNDYEWASVKPEYETGKKTCATSLFYDYLKEEGLIKENNALEEFIELVRQYDTWEWEELNNIDAKRLNDLFYILNREKFEEDMLKRVSEHPNHFFLTEIENMLLDTEEKKIDRYIHSKGRQIIQAVIDDYCIGIVHAEQHLSELGNALNKMYPHLDLIALLNVSGKKVGFRTIHDQVDVAEYAKSFGGGGHPKASGCDMTKDAFEKFVVNVFDLTPLKPDADRNEMNLKEAPYGTSYQNSKGEVSYIRPHHDGTYSIIHKGIKLDYSFKSYVEAESFLKRKDYSWLRFDQDCLKDLAGSIPITMDELKENYINIITDILEKSE
jgi:oligoribonuclease NrnB/cAMP/cGMP phosphodiesterase (DHH superfamily)